MQNYLSVKLVIPSFESNLTDLVVDLDRLRTIRLEGTTHSSIFFELKNLFHTLESIGSARIEGNHTTIIQYIEEKITNPSEKKEENIEEIVNIEKAMQFIEENIAETPISLSFIRELHQRTVASLSPQKEGDKNPGAFRLGDVSVGKHHPPNAGDVPSLMRELTDWINEDNKPKYDLLKIAIAHHRFEWIHPFSNGNGRTGRLFTYALLMKKVFGECRSYRIVNPVAVFCSNRARYYEMLAQADDGTDESMLNWCEYVLEGLKNEITKIDRLLDYSFLKKEILIPAVKIAFKNQFITKEESLVLESAIEKQVIQNADVSNLFPGKSSTTISRLITEMKGKKLLEGETETSRKYHIRIRDNSLLRSTIEQLGRHGFISFD